MGAPAVRSFIGGLHDSDKGLYVSTGGFTKEALYEAERARVPVTLLNLDQFARVFVDNYETTDLETSALLPLTRIYSQPSNWPKQMHSYERAECVSVQAYRPSTKPSTSRNAACPDT